MQPYSYSQSEAGLNQFYAKVYGFVGLGIGLSAIVSALMLTIFKEHILYIFSGHIYIYYIAVAIELFLVMFATKKARENHPLALPLYGIFAVLNGYTLSLIVATYAGSTVYQAFITASGMFLVLALVGRYTKKDLSGIGRACIAGVIGIFIASLVNIFLGSGTMSLIISIIGVILFSGLIAWDNQKIRLVYEEYDGDVEEGWVVSLALELYLDFINLFVHLLRIFGAASRD